MAFVGGENFGKKSPQTKRASLCINSKNRLLKFPYIKRKRKVGKTFGKHCYPFPNGCTTRQQLEHAGNEKEPITVILRELVKPPAY